MATQSANVGVKTQHKEYIANAAKWKKIRDVLSANCGNYLRDVGASEADKAYGAKRQSEYVDGAVFYNFTKRTLAGMVGAVMRKPPEVMLPDELKYLLTNADGAGIGLIQQSQDALKETDSIGRGGLLVDAPETAAATRAEQNAGRLNPRILFYSAENIINWRTTQFGSTKVITMIVLREEYDYQNTANEFDWLTGELYRVLEIVDGVYQQRLFKFDSAGSQTGDFELIEPNISGKRLDYIPFAFIGAENNDYSVDCPPIDSLADVNIGHFRNSADVEESSFICSQPTLMVYPGKMSVAQFKEANPNGLRLGSRSGHNLGEGGGAELLQALPSTLASELMRTKEEQAVKIGAQLITPTIQVTAEAARLQRGADTSIMANVANNVSMAYEQAIKWCGAMLGLNVTDDDVTFELNTEFFLQQMTAQDRAAWIVDINAGVLPVRAYYAALRAAGQTNWNDDEIEDELDRQPPPAAPTLNTEVTGDIPPAPEPEQEEE